MNRSNFHLGCFFVLLTLYGCIEPYDYPAEEKGNNLVVEAAISSNPGPQVVRLTTTRNIYNKGNQYILYINEANVSVIDDTGEVFPFTEGSAGSYYSDSTFRVEQGKKYRLQIITKEGKTYLSSEETALATSPMNRVEVDYAIKTEKNKLGNFVSVDGFDVKAIVNDQADQRNYYLLRMQIVYKVLTDPAAYEAFDRATGSYVHSPKTCCNICWVTKTLDDFVVYSDQLVNGRENAEIPLIFFPVESKYFYEKVYFNVTQFSLSAEGYSFWKALYDLKFRQGTLFDPAPSGLAGNIHNVDDELEQVIGYFTVSDVSTRGEYITKDLIPRNVVYDYLYKDDCRTLPNSTAIQPGFWR